MSDEETGDAVSQLEPYSDDSDNDRRSGEFMMSKLFSKFSGLQPRFSLHILNLPKKPKENHLRESIKNEYKKYSQVRQAEQKKTEKLRLAYWFSKNAQFLFRKKLLASINLAGDFSSAMSGDWEFQKLSTTTQQKLQF